VVLKTKRNDPRVSERSYKMKKVIAILLVLLVTGVVFGDTLTLESTVSGVLKHGFVGSQIATVNFGEINSGVSGAGIGDSYDGIDLFGSGQGVGHYYFASNSANTGYKVSFVVNPIASSTASFQVPYTLTLASEGASSNVTLVTDSISTIGNLGETITASESVDVISTPSNAIGPKYAGLTLAIVIDGEENEAYGLPAATDYSGTIVATVTTH